MLTTPITREELIIGKALAALLPSVAIAYVIYAFFLIAAGLFAQPAISAAIYQSQTLIVQVVYTPLLAAASTWIGLAISTRTADPRVAQQLSMLGSIPLLFGAVALAFDLIHVTPGLLLAIGVVLAVVDAQGWRVVAPMFDRERLITGTRA
jgi:ABC-2 type transport system permease protein